MRSPASLAAAARTAVATLGRIDFLICGAAGNFLAPVSALSENAFKSVVDIDLLGSYNTVKAVLPYLQQPSAGEGASTATGKKILFVSATMHYRGTALQAHAAAAKAGVDALSSTLAIELGPWGITSNVVAPGPILGTEGMDRLKAPGVDDKAVDDAIPLGRQGTVRDVADATVWLFSGAGDWVTGSVVVVDGGHWRMAGGKVEGWPGVMRREWSEVVGERKDREEKAKL